MPTLIKMKWIVMLFLLLYTAGSYLHCAVLYGDILAQKYTIVLDFKDTPVEAVLDAITKQTGIKIAYNNEVLDRKKPVTVKIEKKFNVRFTFRDIVKLKNVGDICHAILTKTN